MGAIKIAQNPPPVWDFFDKIYCITLESRPDRMEEARNQFDQVGLAGNVEFFITQKDQENPVRGIYQSHMHCLEKGVAAQAEHILIFEDDILFRGFDPRSLREACCYLKQNHRWDGFFLGCISDGSRPTGNRNIRRIDYRCLTHGYALRRPFAERIIREPWRGIPYDGLLKQFNHNSFALSPMCAFQRPTPSDNQTVVIDRLRNLFGGLPFIQQCNELYQNNKKLIVITHVLLAAVMLGLFYLFSGR